MCKICVSGVIPHRKISKEIAHIIHKIKAKYHPTKIILFGSYIRGDYNEGSDVDLLIIGDFKERFFDRIGKIIELNDTELDIEPLVYTNEEFERMVKEKRDFMLQILKEGFVC